MPAAVALAASAFTAFATGGTIAGVSAAVTAGSLGLGASLLYGAVEVGAYSILAVGFNALFGPKPPPVQAVQTPIKSGFAARKSGFGRARLSGVYTLFEAKDGVSFDVLALHDGLVDAFERYFLNDDEVVVDAGTGGVWCPADTRKYAYGGPPGDRVFIETRKGVITETVMARANAGLPTVWTSTHRGDRVASMALTCKQSKAKFQAEDFPNGVPVPSAVAKLQHVYDPRDGAQIYNSLFLDIARATWTWSDNPILALMSYLTDAYGGMGLNFDTHITPAIADWIAAADVCDVAVALAAGGTEKRYRLGGVYSHDSDPAEVINQILGTCDGWLAQRGDGALTVRAGHYAAPTVTFTDDHVTAYSVQHFLTDEQALNEVVPSYTDPAKYQTADAGAWRNDADIAARGRVRSKAVDFGWVQSPSQARRLAKRVISRGGQELRGQITTNFYGFAGLGERYIKLQLAENADLANLVIEVQNVKFDLPNLAIIYDWIAADPNIDAWTTAEETTDNVPAARPIDAALTAPTITAITPVYELSASSDTGARLRITVTAPITTDVQWLVRWRVDNGSPADLWNEGAYTDIANGASIILLTGFVTTGVTLNVEVAYVTAGGTSPWSAPVNVAVAAPNTVFTAAVGATLAEGTGITIVDNGDGTFTIAVDGTAVTPSECLVVAISDETTALTTGTAKLTFRMPYAFTLTDVRASLTTAQASGSIFTLDVNESGTSIFSTNLTIDNTEKTSTTAATPAVISDHSLANDAEMTVDIDQVGSGSAKGCKVYLIGHKT